MPSSEGTVQEGTEVQGKKNHAIAREFNFAAFKCDANMKHVDLKGSDKS
jgi:hypothetical protein